MSFPRYPEYKESGVEWLSEVPRHWTVDRIKRSTKSAKNGFWGDEAQGNDEDILCVRVADFDRQVLRVSDDVSTVRNVSLRERQGRLLRRGDLLLEKSGGGEGQPVGCVVLYDLDAQAICSNFVARVELAERMDPSFWRYLHSAAYAVRLNTKSIKQTSGIQNLDASQYLDERCVFPNLDEQKAIAAFLDRETAKIDALIAEQERLMELLKEKRQAVISHAVTKGLNPDEPTKDSNFPSIGCIPAGWSALPFKRFCVTITDGAHISPETENGVYPFVSTKDVSEERLDLEECLRTSAESYEYMVKTGCRPAAGDVLFSKDGTVGRTIVVRESKDFVVASSLVILSPDKSAMNAEFLHLLCQSDAICQQVEAFVKGAGLPRISVQNISRVVASVPPVNEQEAILADLESRLHEFRTLIQASESGIALLQERRTALISAAVTGQIDVRHLANADAA